MKQIIQHSLNICYLPFIFTPLVTGCQPNTENTPKHPNLLFILTDDLQASSIHALGNNDVCTPAIDSLIAAGITFTNTYTFRKAKGVNRAGSHDTQVADGAIRYHKVKSGDTLSRIAKLRGVSVSTLCKLNRIKPTTTLRIGQVLRCS